VIASHHAGKPVLGLHKHVSGRGYWNCIHRGRPISVNLVVDLEEQAGRSIIHRLSDGTEAVLALQGVEEDVDMSRYAPTRNDIDTYIERSFTLPVPAMIRSLEDDAIQNPRVSIPTYSTVVTDEDGDHVFFVCPHARGDIRTSGLSADRMKFHKTRVVADAALGGYWHHSARGTALRAFMRGHYFGETIWTDGVRGWRGQIENEPLYHYSPKHITDCRSVVLIGGMNDPDLISGMNSCFAGKEHVVAHTTGLWQIATAHMLSYEYVPHLVAANGGTKHSMDISEASFLNVAYSADEVAPAAINGDGSPVSQQQAVDFLMSGAVVHAPQDFY